jgi:uncharacterized glyoxalase superfamily protein PhnB
MPNTSARGSAITGVASSFLVDDVVATAEWYRDKLGFTADYYSDDHAHDEDGNDIPGSGAEVYFAIMARDGYRVMLVKTMRRGVGVISNWASKPNTLDAYFWCEGVDEIFAHAKAARAEIIEEPVARPYGIREFTLKDHDGRAITFGAPIDA